MVELEVEVFAEENGVGEGRAMAAPRLEPNSYCAALRCTFSNGAPALANNFESARGSCAFLCSIAGKSLSTAADVLVVGVVRVVVKLIIAGRAGVGMVTTDLI